jgi:phosphoadenosine phosphosulfate reductase
MIAEQTHTLASLSEQLADLNEVDALRTLAELFPGRVVFSTSLGYEDQVITDLIARNDLPIRIFTLDTGRMFGETYSVWNKTLSRYGIEIETMFPKQEAVENLLTVKGPFSMYESVENRKECCFTARWSRSIGRWRGRKSGSRAFAPSSRPTGPT